MYPSFYKIFFILIIPILFGCQPSEPNVVSKTDVALISETVTIDGETLFNENCSSCHLGGVPKAPHLIEFQLYNTDYIKQALMSGVMKQQAAHLTENEIDSLSMYLAGSRKSSKPVKMCSANVINTTEKKSVFEGWGLKLDGTRYIDDKVAKLPKENIENLSLKWAFAYPDASRARSQPVIFANHILVGGQDGRVFALDFDTGCATWTFQADAEVRNAINIAESMGKTVALFGDIKGNVYSINALTGELIWRKSVSEHPDVTLTGSPRLYKEFLYVPLSSKEWASAADPGYECCTFQGGVVKLDINNGNTIWTTHTIAEKAKFTGDFNEMGARRFHPAGVPIWNSPTIDEKRGVLYVGTGESYTSPAVSTSDSVLAIGLDDGEIKWHYQALSGDAWNMACFIGGGPNCPEENGPDLDIGAPPILIKTVSGKEIIAVGQKSGDVFALDPDNNGALLWREKMGRGGFSGGVHWGIASNNRAIFAPIADTAYSETDKALSRAGLYALDPVSGETLWATEAVDVCEEKDEPACDPGLSAAVTVTKDMVFAGAFDGHLRAYDSLNGDIIWDFNTNKEFVSVNGEIANGGAIESDGPIIYDGHVIVNSGYSFGSMMPGNALLVFSTD